MTRYLLPLAILCWLLLAFSDDQGLSKAPRGAASTAYAQGADAIPHPTLSATNLSAPDSDVVPSPEQRYRQRYPSTPTPPPQTSVDRFRDNLANLLDAGL